MQGSDRLPRGTEELPTDTKANGFVADSLVFDLIIEGAGTFSDSWRSCPNKVVRLLRILKFMALQFR